MSDPTIAQSAEVDLLEVWDIIKRYRWVVSGIAASAACIAIAFVLVAKPQWEATAVLQVGPPRGRDAADRRRARGDRCRMRQRHS